MIAGTIFQGTHKSLILWFRAIWWMTGQKNGPSAMGIKRVLGLGSYETAWVWLHKIRRANGDDRGASLLKRWLLGTHQGAVTHQKLDYYLHEFTFPFHRRTSTHRGKLFYRLLQNAGKIEPATYEKIVLNQK